MSEFRGHEREKFLQDSKLSEVPVDITKVAIFVFGFRPLQTCTIPSA